MKIAAAVLGVAAVAMPMATAAAASASPVPQQTRAVTFVTDRPDGGNGSPDPYWADDTMTRTLVITRTGGTPGDYTFSATLADEGEFITIKGAQAPNQAPSYAGEVIRSRSAGIIQGYADFTFTASTLPDVALVPKAENDHGNVPADSTSTWYELAFSPGTVFGGAGIGNWGWTYFAITPHGLQFWSDAYNNNYGDSAGDGQITG
jgi:hypothetical protein